jgi:hypothetical protein
MLYRVQRPKKARETLAQNRNFHEAVQADLDSQLSCRKNFGFSEMQISAIMRHPAPSEGRYGQSSRNVGRDAMDAAAREAMRAGCVRRSRVGYILKSGERR